MFVHGQPIITYHAHQHTIRIHLNIRKPFFWTRSNTKLPRLSFHIYIHMSHGLFLLSLIFVVASVYFDDTCCGKFSLILLFTEREILSKSSLFLWCFSRLICLYFSPQPPFFVFFLFFFLEHLCERDNYPNDRNNEESSQNSSDLTTDIFLLDVVSLD